MKEPARKVACPRELIGSKVLILTSSGGGGLLQGANAKEQEIKESDPHAVVVQKDILKEWFGSFFGLSFAGLWNRAQRMGDVWALKLIVHVCHPLFDCVFWPFLFIGAMRTLFKEDPDRIIDTQPLATSAILFALKIFNRKRKKQLYVEKVLVDFPTDKATHYFRSIKNLSADRRHLIRVVTIQPLLENGETGEEFWRRNCRLSEESIIYEEPYVRTSFRKRRGKPRSDSVMVRYKSRQELELMEKIYRRGQIEAEIKEQEIWFKISPEDTLITVLLGSQPTGSATFNYAKRFLEAVREKSLSKTHLFLFHSERTTLLSQLAGWIEKIKPYPSHFSLIPFSFQKDDAVASLFHRSDLTCTRSGGQTAMELLSVSTGAMWIHSETKGGELSDEQLLKGIPGWEAATAVYLQKVRNAKLVTPERVGDLWEELWNRYTDSELVPSSPAIG